MIYRTHELVTFSDRTTRLSHVIEPQEFVARQVVEDKLNCGSRILGVPKVSIPEPKR